MCMCIDVDVHNKLHFNLVGSLQNRLIIAKEQ